MFGPKSKGAFNRIPITVAFNKLDSFKETYSPEGMKRCFPDVPDAACKDADSALEYIKQTFQDKCKNRQKPTLTHAYNAIDRSQCETLLRKVQKAIMEDAHGTGMLAKTTDASDKDLTKILSAVKAGASVPYDQILNFDGAKARVLRMVKIAKRDGGGWGTWSTGQKDRRRWKSTIVARQDIHYVNIQR